MYDRAVRKQAARKEELSQSAKADTLRLYGELLQANLWAIHKGDRQVTVQNYYTGEDVTIRLDPRLGGNENAQKYFRDYKRSRPPTPCCKAAGGGRGRDRVSAHGAV